MSVMLKQNSKYAGLTRIILITLVSYITSCRHYKKNTVNEDLQTIEAAHEITTDQLMSYRHGPT